MNLQLNRIISNWERSGQGDGGFMEHGDLADEDEYEEENEDGIVEPEFGFLGIVHNKLWINESISPMVRVCISFTSGKCLRSMTCWDRQSNVSTRVYVHQMGPLMYLY
mgnify:CR=1 FL=1